MPIKAPGTDRGGFTLIELLVVVAIIAIMAGVVTAATSGSRAKSRDAQRISDINNIKLAVQFFADRCGQYPSTLALTANNGCPTGVTLGSYLNAVPTPPSGTTLSTYEYSTQTSGSIVTNFLLHTRLEKTNVAVQRGMNTPSGTWSPVVSGWGCSNAEASLEYCIGAF
jgi:prepilin-type N-terminal cleavage/methylation domain-containing protein